jgi:hypothetical protein
VGDRASLGYTHNIDKKMFFLNFNIFCGNVGKHQIHIYFFFSSENLEFNALPFTFEIVLKEVCLLVFKIT